MPLLRAVSVIVMMMLAACSSTPPRSVPKSVPPPSAQADAAAVMAMGLVDTPYLYGGNTPETGFDCSGLIDYVYLEAAGLRLPRSSHELAVWPAPQVPKSALRAGDLLFFATARDGRIGHAGIYVGESRFVHAPSTGGVVRLDRLSTPYWAQAFRQATRPLYRR